MNPYFLLPGIYSIYVIVVICTGKYTTSRESNPLLDSWSEDREYERIVVYRTESPVRFWLKIVRDLILIIIIVLAIAYWE